ncbi:hypothetical protein ACFPC0_10540 [Streptomyces andamanensis]|uniref:Uncharacterized protein n=1 Tax=Streptomyces andamanensis TaxID=1565035 RepID=A0ABV8TCH0_9ACTN
MATRYIVAATPSSPEPKTISNLKAAKAEAGARARLDHVDVEVRTQATNKLTYTAQGAPGSEPTPAPTAEPVSEPATQADTQATEEPAEDSEEPAEDSEPDPANDEAFEAALAELLGEGYVPNPPAADETAPEDGEGDAPEPPTAEEGEGEGDAGEPAQEAHRGVLDCGCSVEKVIETGEHGPECAAAAQAKAQAAAVERDRPARPRRTGGGTRREALGPSVVDGWELLYDKPKHRAQVGRKDGKYALICTDHKHAHLLDRLVQERALRQGKRSVWCPQCTV